MEALLFPFRHLKGGGEGGCRHYCANDFPRLVFGNIEKSFTDGFAFV